MKILGPTGAPAEVPTAKVIWVSDNEAVATHPVTGARIGPFRVLTRNNCKVVPYEHRKPYQPSEEELHEWITSQSSPNPPKLVLAK